jgi:hypothetical protein
MHGGVRALLTFTSLRRHYPDQVLDKFMGVKFLNFNFYLLNSSMGVISACFCVWRWLASINHFIHKQGTPYDGANVAISSK